MHMRGKRMFTSCSVQAVSMLIVLCSCKPGTKQQPWAPKAGTQYLDVTLPYCHEWFEVFFYRMQYKVACSIRHGSLQNFQVVRKFDLGFSTGISAAFDKQPYRAAEAPYSVHEASWVACWEVWACGEQTGGPKPPQVNFQTIRQGGPRQLFEVFDF